MSDCCNAIRAYNDIHESQLDEGQDCCVRTDLGIVCEGGKVTEINWGSKVQSGSLPDEIGNLENLKVLDLGKNHLSGYIPSSYYKLDKLETLSLKENALSGQLESFDGLSSLRSLDISNNFFSDKLQEDSFINLNELKFINVGNNPGLTGLFPKPGPKVSLINTVGTDLTLCDAAAKVAVPAYFMDPTKVCPGMKK